MLLQSRSVDEQEAHDQLIRELQKQVDSLEEHRIQEVDAVRHQV